MREINPFLHIISTYYEFFAIVSMTRK